MNRPRPTLRVPLPWFWTALILLAAWLPASSHEWLESVGLIHGEDHHSDRQGNEVHDAADGICRLEGGYVLVKAPAAAGIACIQWRDTEVVLQSTDVFVLRNGLPRGNAPPGLVATWHFDRRSALPARDPGV